MPNFRSRFQYAKQMTNEHIRGAWRAKDMQDKAVLMGITYPIWYGFHYFDSFKKLERLHTDVFRLKY
ncbi:MAG TPA: hypothetical protein VJH04_04170 [archaeon]|nr:hypothetical protein [archaeon]